MMVPKRFVDTALWDKPWFRKLPPDEKEAWRFICDKCDTVGVWEAHTEIADAFIGAKVNWEHLREACNGNIEVMKNGKWHLVDFVSFQYGELVDTNNAHRSYLSLLRKHGLSGAGQGLGSPWPAPLEKEKDKDILKKEPKPFFNTEINKWENVTDDMIALWEKAYPACDMERELTKMAAWLLANPKKAHKSSYTRFITGWLSRTQDKGGTR